nr:putative retrotransposon Ty1-copia subclass protein [Tanacetum cinerariifolium]
IKSARATPKAHLPYGMFLTRLFRHVMEHYRHLDNGIYDVVERVMRALALRQARRPRSDRGKARHSVSSTFAYHNRGSSSHHGDDDEDDDASRASTPSPTTNLNSLGPLDYQPYDISTSFEPNDDLLFERQTDLLNQTQQMHKELRVEDKLPFLEQPIPAMPVPPAGQAKHELLQTVREFHACKQEEGQSKPHKAVKGNQGKGKSKMGYAPVPTPPFAHKPKNPPTPKKDNPVKDAICHQCGEVGHWRRNCSVYLADSMFAISNKRSKLDLDSTLLWHCHLGHINKKRIEKLQHDGLLNSADIKTFEKCVSCMSGKMARKPYSHQMERAKDLLGLIHTDDDQEIKEPQSDINPIRKSLKTCRASDRMCLHVDDKEHELGDLGEPANYKVALLDPESDKWLDAVNVEMQSMKDNEEYELRDLGEPANYKAALLDPESDKWINAINVQMQSIRDKEVWELVDLPPNGKSIGYKWLFKKKTDIDRAVHTYKACLVAKGFTQTPWIDYEETFSPVADIRAIRILIAIAAFYDYEI